MSLSANKLSDPIPRAEEGRRKAARKEIHRILKEEKGGKSSSGGQGQLCREPVGDRDPIQWSRLRNERAPAFSNESRNASLTKGDRRTVRLSVHGSLKSVP